MRALKALICGTFLFQTSCSVIEEHLASMLEPDMVPSAIAEVFTGIPQAFAAQSEVFSEDLGLNLCPTNGEEGEAETPPSSLSCSDSKKTIDTSACSTQEGFDFSGTISFQFETEDCQSLSEGQSLERLLDVKLSGYQDLVSLSVGGGRHGTYNKVRIPATGEKGVQILTKNSDGWSYQSTGARRYGTFPQVNISPLNLSLRTVEDFSFTVEDISLPDPTAKILLDPNGKIQLFNNSLKYNVTLSATTPLEMESCTCPTAGKLEGVAKGKKLDANSGAMSLEFKECGVADFYFRGETHSDVKLDMCSSFNF